MSEWDLHDLYLAYSVPGKGFPEWDLNDLHDLHTFRHIRSAKSAGSSLCPRAIVIYESLLVNIRTKVPINILGLFFIYITGSELH